jgi:hypothetical protein
MVESASRVRRGNFSPTCPLVAASYVARTICRDPLRGARNSYVSYVCISFRIRPILTFCTCSFVAYPYSCAVVFASITSSSAPSLPTPSRPSAGKPRDKAAKRRARDRRKDPILVAELTGTISALRHRLQLARNELSLTKADRLSLISENSKVVERFKLLCQEFKKSGEAADARYATLAANIQTEVKDAVRSAEDSLRVEHKRLSAKIVADNASLKVENARLLELSGRLRLERDIARTDSLKFNKERNDLRLEVAGLIRERSEKIAKAAKAPRISFPGTPPWQ